MMMAKLATGSRYVASPLGRGAPERGHRDVLEVSRSDPRELYRERRRAEPWQNRHHGDTLNPPSYHEFGSSVLLFATLLILCLTFSLPLKELTLTLTLTLILLGPEGAEEKGSRRHPREETPPG